MKITFFYAGKKQGLLCDNCGTYIENIYIIETQEGTFKIECECFKKLQEKSNLSDYGKKWLKKKLNWIIKLNNQVIALKTYNVENIKKSGINAIDNKYNPIDGYTILTGNELKLNIERWIKSTEYLISKEQKEIENITQKVKIKI